MRFKTRVRLTRAGLNRFQDDGNSGTPELRQSAVDMLREEQRVLSDALDSLEWLHERASLGELMALFFSPFEMSPDDARTQTFWFRGSDQDFTREIGLKVIGLLDAQARPTDDELVDRVRQVLATEKSPTLRRRLERLLAQAARSLAAC